MTGYPASDYDGGCQRRLYILVLLSLCCRLIPFYISALIPLRLVGQFYAYLRPIHHLTDLSHRRSPLRRRLKLQWSSNVIVNAAPPKLTSLTPGNSLIAGISAQTTGLSELISAEFMDSSVTTDLSLYT